MRMTWVNTSSFVILTLAGCASVPSSAPPSPSPRSPGYRTQVIFLGTGNPYPLPERSGPSTAVVVDGVAYVFDAGPGVVRRAAAAMRRHGIEGLWPARIRHVFITHLHSDHTVGLPDLMFTSWTIGRPWPLEVYGPPGIGPMTDHLWRAFAEDIEVRSHAEHQAVFEASKVNAHDVVAGRVYEDERVKITAFPVTHGSWAHSFGYRVDGPDRSIVITGDYAPSESVVTACDGCDLLVSEGYPTSLVTRAPQREKYLRAYHISGVELGALATRARAKALVLTHRAAGSSEDQAMIDEVKRGYSGPVTVAADLDRM